MSNDTSNVPTTTAKEPKKLIDYLKSAQFMAVLPDFMQKRSDAFIRLAMNDIPRSPALAKIAAQSPKKIVNALMECARVGLMPGPLGHVYLVPFGDEVQVVIGYKGLLDLARRSGEVARIDADVIYAEDDFSYIKGDEPKFQHTPNLRSTKRTNNDIVAAYAFAYDREGRNLGGTVMAKADVDAIRGRSKTGKSGPWSTDYAEMAKKTAVRRASKMWPVSVELTEGLAMEDAQEERLPTVVSSSGALENRPPIVSGDLYADDMAADGVPSHTFDGEPVDPTTGEVMSMTPPPRS